VFLPAAILAAVLAIETRPPCAGDLVAGGERVQLHDGRAHIRVEAEGLVTLESDTCWAAPIAATGTDAAVVMRTWPRSEVHGRVRVSRNESPAGFTGEIQSSDIAKTRVECTTQKETWRCVVPRTKFDLRLSADGYAPVYLWNVERNDAGEITLTRGASITGWALADGDAAEGAMVSLSPESYARADVRGSLREQTIATNARGFFQFRGVAPGTYVLSATKRGRSTARTIIRVAKDEEQRIDRFDLPPLATLAVQVTPAVDAHGKPWRVRVFRVETPRRALSPITTGSVAPTGEWRGDGYEHGSYLVDVGNEAGAIFAQQDVEIDREFVQLTASVALVPVAGRVRAGETPLESDIRFDSEAGQVTMHSDRDGMFAGSLPAEGQWNVAASTMKDGPWIYLDDVDVTKNEEGIARVDLDFPATHLRGRVVDEDGAAIARGNVLVLRKGHLLASMNVDAQGEFSAIGIAPGELILLARTPQGDSPETRQTLAEDADALFTIVVPRRVTLKGHVRDASGVPVSGAVLRFIASGGRLGDTATGPDGQFALEMPPGATSLDVVVVPPGGALKIASISQSQPDITLQSAAGRLHISISGAPPWPAVGRGGRRFPLTLLFRPRYQTAGPSEMNGNEFVFDLEAGPYSVCGGGRCEDVIVRAGASATFDARIKEGS